MRRSSLFTIAVAAAFITASAAQAQIKVALDSQPDLQKAGSYVWAHVFTQYLNEHGLKAKEFPRNALGGEAERLDQVSQGLLEVSMSDLKSAGKIDKLIFGVYLPYLFKDNAHLDRAIAAAGIFDKVNATLAKNGVRILALTVVGPAAGIHNTKKPIHTVQDMADLRMRALDESQIALYKAWGTRGTIVSWREVPNALQTGVADGYLNPVHVPLMFGHTDFIKYFTDAKIVVGGRLAIASNDWYGGLSAKDRPVVDAAVAAATKANREWLRKFEPGLARQAEAAGIKIVTLTPEARAEFERRSRKVYKTGTLSPEQVQLWLDAAAKTR